MYGFNTDAFRNAPLEVIEESHHSETVSRSSLSFHWVPSILFKHSWSSARNHSYLLDSAEPIRNCSSRNFSDGRIAHNHAVTRGHEQFHSFTKSDDRHWMSAWIHGQ